MTTDRITQLRIAGLRSIADVTIDLRGLTVLIGDNGTGKSTILDALELMRASVDQVKNAQDVGVRRHGGMKSLLRRGSEELRLGIRIEGGGPVLDYEYSTVGVGNWAEITSEYLDIRAKDSGTSLRILERDGATIRVRATPLDENVPEIAPPPPSVGSQRLLFGSQTEGVQLALPILGGHYRGSFARVVNALSRMDLQSPFETRPIWQQNELDTRQGPRREIELMEAEELARFGVNLPNAFHSLRDAGGEVWDRVLDRGKLGLGDDLVGFTFPAAKGRIELAAAFSGMPGKPVTAESLSDGQVAYLAFIALCELNPQRSLLAFDEPELHLHPALLTRVLWMLEEVAQRCPVILSTHSDRLLDSLSDPANQVVLCELDEHRATRLIRPNAERLASWMERYRGLGSIRSEGYEAYVFDPTNTPAEEPAGEEK